MKKCCINCFEDWKFVNYIEKNGFISNCDFCKQIDEKCLYLDNEIFAKVFSLLRNMYTESQNIKSKTLYSIIGEWNLFSDSTADDVLLNVLCKLHGIKYEGYYVFNTDYNHLTLEWYKYKNTVKHQNRFINSLPSEIEKLLSNPPWQFNHLLSKRDTLFRARIGGADGNTTPHPKNLCGMGMPPINLARSGRANPDGIAYLYLASSEETAIAEIRPGSGAVVTVATFNLIESLSTINFSVFNNKSLFDYMESENLENAISQLQFFNNLSSEMSQPISSCDSYLEYIPTQYVTEFIKTNDYDGIIFDSSLGSGQNVVLFNQDSVGINATELIKIEQIRYFFTEVH